MGQYGKRVVTPDFPEFAPGNYEVLFGEFFPTRKVDNLPTPAVRNWGGRPVLIINYRTILTTNAEPGPAGSVRLLEGGLPLLVKAFSGDATILPSEVNADATPELLLAVQDHLVAKAGEATAVVNKKGGFMSYLAEAFPPVGDYALWYKEVVGRTGAETLVWEEHKWGPRVWLHLVIAAGPWAGTRVQSRWDYALDVDEETLEITLPYKSDGEPTKANLRFQVPLNLFGRPDEFDAAGCGDVYNLLPEIVENIESTEQEPVMGTVKGAGWVDLLDLKRPGAGITISPDIPSPLSKAEKAKGKPKAKRTEPKKAAPAEETKPAAADTTGIQQDEQSKLDFAQSQFRAVVEQCVREMFPDKPTGDVRVWPLEDSEEPWRFLDGSEGRKWGRDVLVSVVESLDLEKIVATWSAQDIADIMSALPEPAKAAGKLLNDFLASGAKSDF